MLLSQIAFPFPSGFLSSREQADPNIASKLLDHKSSCQRVRARRRGSPSHRARI